MAQPYEPPFSLRRPSTWEDFYRIEQHVRYWWGSTCINRPMQIPALSQLPANYSAGLPGEFWKTTYGVKRQINPVAKSWCFFLLEDSFSNIIGIFFGVGLTESAKNRHLQPRLDELPIEDTPWSQIYVPDPAHPKTARHAAVVLLTDWNRPAFVNPLLDACNKAADLLQIQTLFIEVIHTGPAHNLWMTEQMGFRKVRTCRSQTREQTPISVWVWERQATVPVLQRQFGWELEANSSQVELLANFYQQLSQAQRDELILICKGHTIPTSIQIAGLGKRAVEARRTSLRKAISLREQEWCSRGLLPNATNETGCLLACDLSSLLCQPSVSQAIRRIHWFYDH